MKKLYTDTWSLFDTMVRVFLIVGNKRALVVDSGVSGLEIRSIVRQYTDLPLLLLNTHADRDHIASNAGFAEIYMHPSEMPYYHNIQHGPGRLIPVSDGDTIDLGGRILEVVHIPGHTPGSISVLDRAGRCLIGGDPVQEDGEIYMFGPQRDFDAYIAGLTRLTGRDDFDCVYPSHGKEKVSRDAIPALIEGARRILSGEIRAQEREIRGMKIRCCDAGVSRFLCEPLPEQAPNT